MKLYANSSWLHWLITAIGWLYSKIALIELQSQTHQKWLPQRYRLLSPIDKQQHAVLPTNECKSFSCAVHARYPNQTGKSRAPSRLKSNWHFPVFERFFIAQNESSSLASCRRIRAMPWMLQSVLRNVGLDRSNRLRTGLEVMLRLVPSKSWMRDGDQANIGIGWRKYCCRSCHIGLSLILWYGINL